LNIFDTNYLSLRPNVCRLCPFSCFGGVEAHLLRHNILGSLYKIRSGDNVVRVRIFCQIHHAGIFVI
jgi:hypothetical protein